LPLSLSSLLLLLPPALALALERVPICVPL
jgi:hypothetical protein